MTITIDDADDDFQAKVFIAAKMLIDANFVLFDDAWTMVSSVSSKHLLNAATTYHLVSLFCNLLLQRMSYLT